VQQQSSLSCRVGDVWGAQGKGQKILPPATVTAPCRKKTVVQSTGVQGALRLQKCLEGA